MLFNGPYCHSKLISVGKNQYNKVTSTLGIASDKIDGIFTNVQLLQATLRNHCPRGLS